MAINTCINAVAVTALVTLLVMPIDYYVTRLYQETNEPKLAPRPLLRPIPATFGQAWFSLNFPPLELFLTVTLILTAIVTYLCRWIQRKLIERRILKMNQYVNERIDRLRVWDSRQEQLDATLRMVQNATSEYNLLLFLLLRHHRLGPPARKPPSRCFLESKHHEVIDFLTNPAEG